MTDRPYGCSCGPDPHGSSSACSAYNVLYDCKGDHVIPFPPGNADTVYCQRCGNPFTVEEWTARLLRELP